MQLRMFPIAVVFASLLVMGPGAVRAADTSALAEDVEAFFDVSFGDLQEELEIIQEYLPEALSEAEINDLVEKSIASTGAESIKDMGKVMGMLKPRLQGRADMGKVSQLIKSRLSD